MSNTIQRRQFSLLAFIFQTLFVILFAMFGRFQTEKVDAKNEESAENYPMFQDFHVIMVIGFGFLLSFLNKDGFSALSINLLIISFIIQYSLLIRGFLSHSFVTTGAFDVSLKVLIQADLSCVCIQITMGILLGNLTPVQFLLLAFLECSFVTILEHILFNILCINDAGRSLTVHCFGAYFGLVAAKMCHKKNLMNSDEESSKLPELFAMLSTLLLWAYFPSFNAIAQTDQMLRHRAVLNTYLAMASCGTTTFVISSLTDHLGRFDMLHIQTSTLAGGVAIGNVANVLLLPHHAILIGSFAALASVFGHIYITPKVIEKRLSLYENSVHNLHGIPGLLGGLLGVACVLIYSPSDFDNNLQLRNIYPQMRSNDGFGQWDPQVQAILQFVGVILTLVWALTGGLIGGYLMNWPMLNQVQQKPSYEDKNYYQDAELSLFGKFGSGISGINSFDDLEACLRSTELIGTRNSMKVRAVY